MVAGETATINNTDECSSLNKMRKSEMNDDHSGDRIFSREQMIFSAKRRLG